MASLLRHNASGPGLGERLEKSEIDFFLRCTLASFELDLDGLAARGRVRPAPFLHDWRLNQPLFDGRSENVLERSILSV
jgi:hypothetical protein